MANEKETDFDLLASFLEYPKDDSCTVLMQQFVNSAKVYKLEDLQESYIETFEINPACSLNSGVHIFGEDSFKRGMFMARLKQAYEKYGLKSEPELPDFIPSLLRLAKKLEDKQQYRDLLAECIISPLNSVLNNLKSETPYQFVLNSVKKIVELELEGESIHA